MDGCRMRELLWTIFIRYFRLRGWSIAKPSLTIRRNPYVSTLRMDHTGLENTYERFCGGWEIDRCRLTCHEKRRSCIFAVFEDMCLDIVFDWETEDCEDSKMTECVGHFDDVVTWSVAASVLDSYPLLSVACPLKLPTYLALWLRRYSCSYYNSR